MNELNSVFASTWIFLGISEASLDYGFASFLAISSQLSKAFHAGELCFAVARAPG